MCSSDLSDPVPKMRKRRTYTIMARSSTVVGHVGYHLSMAVVKSRAGSDQKSTREIRPIRAMKKTESQKHTLSMIKPRFFTLTNREPSIGRTHTHVHNKIKFYYNQYLLFSMMMNKKEREEQTLIKRR